MDFSFLDTVETEDEEDYDFKISKNLNIKYMDDENSIYNLFFNNPNISDKWKNAFLKDDRYNSLLYISSQMCESEYDYFPAKNLIFKSFELIDLKDIKVVMWGDKPYIGYRIDGTTIDTGIAFNLLESDNINKPVSNMFKEIYYNYSNLFDGKSKLDFNQPVKESLFKIPSSPSLLKWFDEGIFLINVNLTYNKFKTVIWDNFMTNLVDILNETHQNLIHIIYGPTPKYLMNFIASKNIILCNHPSNYYYNGSKEFIKINILLRDQNKKQINFNFDEDMPLTIIENNIKLSNKYI